MDPWQHTCRMTYCSGTRPAIIAIDARLERCPYCGEVSPVRQAEVDALAAEMLKPSQSVKNDGLDRIHLT